MAEQNIFDDLQKSLGDAVQDIREKVVEEPMWGRTLTDHAQQQEAAPTWPEPQQQITPDPTPAVEQEQQHPQEQDIER